MTWKRLLQNRATRRNSARRNRRATRRLEWLEPRELLTYVEMDTSYGTIHLWTTNSQAASSFVHLLTTDAYDNTIFHRLVPGATLSGGRFHVDGSPVTRNANGTTSFSSPNIRGSIAAIPAEGTNQFSGGWFINLADNPQLDSAGYMVIGYIESEDMRIVDTIAALPTFDIRGHESVPLRDYVLEDPPRLPGPENFVVVTDARQTPVRVSLQDAAFPEGNGELAYGFVFATLSVSSDFLVQISYATVNGTARAGEDYQESSGTLFLNAGQTGQTIRIPIYSDREFEADETIRVRIVQVSGGSVVDGEAILTIVNDDRGVPGDTNFDNRVDLDDLNNVRNHFGDVGEDLLGDVTDDDVVDLAELNIARNHFGEFVEPPSIASTAVASRVSLLLATPRVFEAFDAVYFEVEQSLSRAQTRFRRRNHLQPLRIGVNNTL